ncbi:MAG TPA: glycerate kinase [Bacteroidales bacterium]|nr:glycerate kinase [Bacteroidales bacterium]
MRVLIATDSFKNSLTAKQAAQSIAAGWRKIFADAQIELCPVADGGEGTVQSLIDATGGRMVRLLVKDPLLRPVDSFFGILGDGTTAVIEMAASSGIELLKPEELSPLETSTFGTGQLMLKALEMGCRRMIIGIGGSATIDGGVGMAVALGAEFTDGQGKPLAPGGGSLGNLVHINIGELNPGLANCEIIVAADVTTPLHDAVRIYGPQKGASPQQVKQLEKNLAHYGDILHKTFGRNIAAETGSGAAGGLGAGLLAFAGARMMAGFEVVRETVGLDEKISKADLVITGEGKTDAQTQYGKTPFGVAQVAKKYNKSVISFAGALGADYQVLYQQGFDVIFPITDKPMPLSQSISDAAMLLEDAAERIARMLLLSQRYFGAQDAGR